MSITLLKQQQTTLLSSVVTRQSHNSVYDLAMRAHFQEYSSDRLMLLARYVGQIGIISLTKDSSV